MLFFLYDVPDNSGTVLVHSRLLTQHFQNCLYIARGFDKQKFQRKFLPVFLGAQKNHLIETVLLFLI